MVRALTYGELLRAVPELMKENMADQAVFRATVDRFEKLVEPLEQEMTLLTKLHAIV